MNYVGTIDNDDYNKLITICSGRPEFLPEDIVAKMPLKACAFAVVAGGIVYTLEASTLEVIANLGFFVSPTGATYYLSDWQIKQIRGMVEN